MQLAAEWKLYVDKVTVITYFLPWNNGLQFYMNFIDISIIHAPAIVAIRSLRSRSLNAAWHHVTLLADARRS